MKVLPSMLFLISLAAVYAATGSLNLAQLSGRIADLPEPVALMLQLLLLTTFACYASGRFGDRGGGRVCHHRRIP